MNATRRWLWPVLCAFAAGCGAPEARNEYPAYNPGVIRSRPTTEIPILPGTDLTFLVNLTINGEPGVFALDTGADYTVLSPEFAAKAGLLAGAYNGWITVEGGDQEPRKFAKIGNLVLGEFAFIDFQAPIMNLDHIKQALRTNVDGIVGNNILRKSQYTLDWRNRTLTLDAVEHPRPANAIPIHLHGNIMFVTARANGRLVDFVIDTGAYRSLISDKDFARLKIPLEKQKQMNGMEVDYAQARIAQRTEATLDTLNFGGVSRTNHPVLVWRTSVLGMDLLSQWRLVIDARQGWISLADPPPPLVK